MSPQARRVRPAPRPSLERLEARTLLTADYTRVVAAWGATDPVDPAESVIVRFLPGVTGGEQAADLDAVGGRVVRAFDDGPSVVALPPWADRDAALSRLVANGDMKYAEADAVVHAAGAAVTPNDPKFFDQWGLGLIDAPQAWSVTTGTNTLVAVLDTGIDLNNPDFAFKVWTNPDTSGRDGYRGALHGWNFVTSTPNVQDNNGHGSHVTGVLAAAGNNGYGIAGVDWNAVIMPVKVLDGQGNGSTDAAVAGVYYAVNHGAKVINASWGGDVFSQSMLDALNYANAHNVVFVTVAGNESSNNDAVTTYPASYRTPNELVVAAVDRSGNLADFSNRGAATVDLAAPGVDVVSDVVGGFQTYSGTSMATPYVSGTVALLAGAHPELSAAQLVARVRATVKPIPALYGQLISPGVVDPYNALTNRQASAGGGSISISSTPTPVPGNTPFADVEAAVLTNDSVVALFGGTPAAWVAGLYRALLARDAGPSEVDYFTAAMRNGATRADVVRRFQTSTEGARTRAARWYADELGAAQPVGVLKADPGVIAWAGLTASGVSDSDVQAGMFASDPYYQGHGGTSAGFVSALYVSLLGRGADPAGLAYFSSQVDAGANRGEVARQILASPEGHRTTVARLYRNELARATPLADLKNDPGVGFWAGYLGLD